MSVGTGRRGTQRVSERGIHPPPHACAVAWRGEAADRLTGIAKRDSSEVSSRLVSALICRKCTYSARKLSPSEESYDVGVDSCRSQRGLLAASTYLETYDESSGDDHACGYELHPGKVVPLERLNRTGQDRTDKQGDTGASQTSV